MKKSELIRLIEEVVKQTLNEDALVLTKDFGGYDDKKFLYIVWRKTSDELKKIN